MTCVVGVDPGKSGGVAVFIDGSFVTCFPVPLAGDVVDISEMSRAITACTDAVPRVFIEQVGAMPGQGVTSMFNFGRTFGRMESVALMNSWPLEYVRPQAWKKKVLAGTSKDKEAAIAFVRARFPGAPLTLPRCRTPHDGMADAVCIGYYGCLTCSS